MPGNRAMSTYILQMNISAKAKNKPGQCQHLPLRDSSCSKQNTAVPMAKNKRPSFKTPEPQNSTDGNRNIPTANACLCCIM